MEITANALQTIAVNNNVLFTETPIPGNCSMIHREGSGLVTLRGLTRQCRALFKVTFSGNIGVPAGGSGPLDFAIALNGEGVEASRMMITPSATGQFFNISSTIFVVVPANCCTQVSVRNIGTNTGEIRNANLVIERVA